MDTKLADYITDLALRNPGHLSQEEYCEIAQTIVDRAPCRVLIFGLGKDSALWLRCNRDGTTKFVEDSDNWIEKTTNDVRVENLQLPVVKVRYFTKQALWKEEIRGNLGVPQLSSELPYDVILVDGPLGCSPNVPGRLQSIFEAGRLCAKGGVIFVHDMDRPLEQGATQQLLVETKGLSGPTRIGQRLASFSY
jgi:hypothetical protein